MQSTLQTNVWPKLELQKKNEGDFLFIIIIIFVRFDENQAIKTNQKYQHFKIDEQKECS